MCFLYTVSNTIAFHFLTTRQCLYHVAVAYPSTSMGLLVKWALLKSTKGNTNLTLSCFLSPCSLILSQLLKEFLPYISFLCWVLFVSDRYWRWKVRRVPLICHIDIYPKCSFSLFLRMSYCRYSSQSELVFSSQALRQTFLTKRATAKLHHFPLPQSGHC